MSELLNKAIDQALENFSKEFPDCENDGENGILMRSLIDLSRAPKYRSHATNDEKVFFSLLLIDLALIYGQLQFDAGVEAARQSIVSDNPVPPQFVP